MFRKNVAGQFIHFQGVDATTGGIKTGVTWTIRRCIDGTFAAGGGTVTEDGTTGWYKYAMSQADTNGNNIGFNFTGTGAVPQTVNIITDGSPPDVNLKNAAGTAVTLDANNVLNVSTKYWAGTAITATSIPVATAAGATNGLLIAGSNAPTTFAGSGSSAGLTVTGGSSATGAFVITGGSSSGSGIVVTTTSGDAVTFTSSGTAKNGFVVSGSSSGSGFKIIGGSGGGAPLVITSPGGNPAALISVTGGGASTVGLSISATAGGIVAQGGTGYGIWAYSTSTHGVRFEAAGSSGDAISLGTPSGDGIGCEDVLGGYGLNGSINGNITGNLSGSVGSLTSGERNSIADAVLTRDVSSVEGTANDHSLCYVVLASSEWSVSGTVLTVKKTTGATFATKTLIKTANDDPVRGAD